MSKLSTFVNIVQQFFQLASFLCICGLRQSSTSCTLHLCEATAAVDFLWPIHVSKVPLSTQAVTCSALLSSVANSFKQSWWRQEEVIVEIVSKSQFNSNVKFNKGQRKDVRPCPLSKSFIVIRLNELWRGDDETWMNLCSSLACCMPFWGWFPWTSSIWTGIQFLSSLTRTPRNIKESSAWCKTYWL